MTLSDFLYLYLSPICKTVPVVAPIETPLPIIVYTIEGQELQKAMSGGGVAQNFVNITIYSDEYDKANDLAIQIKEALECDLTSVENIIGASYQSSSNGYNQEPVKRYFVALEYIIFERI